MGWLSSLFSSDNNPPQNIRKGQAMSSTHEAFSLPTSSPILSSHSDVFHPDGLNTPDPDSAVSPSYTYPPAGGSYGYVAASAQSHSRPPSLLPTHHDPLHTPLTPPSGYPPLARTWSRLQTWLTREYPELGDTLNYGILPQDLAQIEMQFGFALPAVVRESYLVVDGQEAESAAGCSEGLFFGLTLLPLEDVLEEWRFWREVDDDPVTGANPRLRDLMQSIPPGWVRKEYSQRGWLPLITDKTGNYIGIDLNPAESGSVGQVIVFGRDFDTKVVLWNGDGVAGWAKWLASFVEELEGGEGFEIGASNEASEGSEDDVGYESYFYDGSGRGQGDGGGDSGSGGGLRLTGEYRGWSPLEAWADRSVRRWYEAGVIQDDPMLQEEEEDLKGKGPEKAVGLGVLHMPDAAQVHIPVLADISEPTNTNTRNHTHTHNHTTSRPRPTDLPTISITKPPAPLPVDVPTPHDIDVESPSDPMADTVHSPFTDDLESGLESRMREVAITRTTTREVSPKEGLPTKPPQSHIHEIVVPTATVSVSTPIIIVDQQQEQQEPPTSPPDLLADSAPLEMVTTPIEPSSPARPEVPLSTSTATTPIAAVAPAPITVPAPASVPIPTPIPTVTAPTTSLLDNAVLSEEPEHEEHDNADDAEPQEQDPDTTIRLIGGGGTAGIVSEDSNPPHPGADDGELTDTGSITSATSVTSAGGTKTKTRGTHKKTKSGLAGLKKLGHLGGLRKRDSVSSTGGDSAKDASDSK